jgi:hypothetical protein
VGQPVLGAELNRSENWGEESRLTQPLSQRPHLAHLLPHPPARGNRLRGVEAAHTKVAQNRAVTAAFRRYDSVSVCGIGPWSVHFGSLSPGAIFGVSFFTERRGGAVARYLGVIARRIAREQSVAGRQRD